MKKHFVTFYSPGTFVAEQTTKEISAWDHGIAIEMMESITERYGAKPYGFSFTTKKRGFRDFEPKEIKSSGMYYVNCKVETLEEIQARCEPGESILLRNMKTNGWDKIVTPLTGWSWSQPLREGDVVL
jgi:hypothetical protein